MLPHSSHIITTTLMALTTAIASANEKPPELTLYNQAALYGASEKKELDEGNFYLKMPSSLIEDSLVLKTSNNVDVVKKEYKSNNFQKLLKANIGKTIAVDDKKGVLKSVDNRYLILENNGKKSHIKISSVDSFGFAEIMPLENNVYEVYTDSSKDEQNISYNYLFRGVQWHTNHQLFMDEDNNIHYRSDLVIDNTTDMNFEDIKLNLMAGDINLSTHQPRRQMMATSADSAESYGQAQKASFNSFEGFQRLRFPNEVSLENNAKTDLSFQNFKNIPNRKEYRFSTLRPAHQKVEDRKAEMFLILEREDNDDYHFPFTRGKVSVYKGVDPKKATLLTRQSIDNHSEDDDVKIGLGESFDVDLDYKSKKIDEHRSVYSQSKDRTRYKVTKDYQFTVTLKNNEPSEVVAIYDFSGSKTHSKPIKVTIPAESEVEATHDVQYQTFRYQ